MEIIKTANNQIIIDKQLFDYINNIWISYDVQIPNDKKIFFMKNTTIPRLVTDYCGKNIRRVIKKENADYCIISKIPIENFPLYYDRAINSIVTDDTKEVFYTTSYLHPDNLSCLEQILDFYNLNLKVIYVNQNILNESLNTGFVIDKDNYNILTELVNSNNKDNYSIAASMLINSDLDKNKEWLCYVYHGCLLKLIENDKNNIVRNYFSNKQLNLNTLCNVDNFDTMFKSLTDQDVKDKFIQLKKHDFYKGIKEYMQNKLRTNLFVLRDFQLEVI